MQSLFFALLPFLHFAEAPVELRLQVSPEAGGQVRIELRGELGPAEGRRLSFARGLVGGYAPADYAPYLRELRAWNAAGTALTVEEHAQRGWVLHGTGELARITYGVDTAAQERGLGDASLSSRVREDYAFLNGYGLFLRLDGVAERVHRLELELPEDWPVVTTLEKQSDGRLIAHDAFELIDAPLMLGPAVHSARVSSRGVHLYPAVAIDLRESIEFGPAGADSLDVPASPRKSPVVRFARRQPIWLSRAKRAAGGFRGPPDVKRYCNIGVYVEGNDPPEPLLQRLVDGAAASAAALRALELPASPERYQFLFETFEKAQDEEFGWAVERAHSTHCVDDAESAERSPFRAAYHLTHHELHAWMPRRLYTESLHPARMIELEPSGYVWFAEGIPQYLAFCGLSKAGCFSRELVLRGLARRFGGTYGEDAPGEPISLNDLSTVLSVGGRTGWFHNFAGGALLALWIDEDMRRIDPERGLLEALHDLSAEFLDHPRGIPEGDFVERLSRLTGLQLAERFKRHVFGSEPLPVAQILSRAGIVPDGRRWRVLPDEECGEEVLRFRDGALR